jgi:hypothetical protein
VAAAVLQTATVCGNLPAWESADARQDGTLHQLGRARVAAGAHERTGSEPRSRTEGPAAAAAAAAGGRSCTVQPRKAEPGAVAGRIRSHSHIRSRSAAGEAEALACRAAEARGRRLGGGIRWRSARR